MKRQAMRNAEDDVAWLVERYGGPVPRYTSYPTAPHFNAQIDAGTYGRWLTELGSDEDAGGISVYVHVPFCRSLCWYCGCNMSVVRSHAPIDDYLAHLRTEMCLVRRYAGRRVPLRSLHFGGGTPNFLGPADLVAVFAALHENFVLEPASGIAAEIDPRLLTSEWIAAAVAHGINRVSLGVQDVNADVQQAVNRIQPLTQIAWCVDALRAANLESINIDLMYGLPLQTELGIKKTVETAIALAPDRIALFGYAHVPWMKPAQRLFSEETLPNVKQRFDQQRIAAEMLADAGYVRVGLDHFARVDDELATAPVYRNFQGYTTDDCETLIGLGPSAIGHLPKGYVQNAPKMPTWRQCLADGKLATVRGIAVSTEDACRGEIIARLMCDLRADFSEVADRFNRPADGLILDPARLGAMEADGLVRRRDTLIEITERGRPFVRSVCAVFDRYLQQSAVRHSMAV